MSKNSEPAWLMDDVTGLLNDFADSVLCNYDDFPPTETAKQIIALVRADERKRICEALEAMYDKVKEVNTDIMGGYDMETAGRLEGLSAAMDLTEEGADHE